MEKPLEFEKPIAELEEKLAGLEKQAVEQEVDLSEEIDALRERLVETRKRIYAELTPWQRVQIARHTQRPFLLDYLAHTFDEFCELHGDRVVGDDRAMPGGLARLGEHRCVVIGHQKGRDTKENLERNFGSAHPEGYRKALRLMEMGERFGLPVVALIDTPGAFPGIGAEERNIAEAIARNLRDMMALSVPVVAVVLGEGGSGGALGIGIANRVLMMENSYYSVISPEGCAAILWKHRDHAPEAAEAMKLSAPDLLELGLIDEVVKEPEGGAHHDVEAAASSLREALTKHLNLLSGMAGDALREERYEKFRSFGVWQGEELA
ncbi:MAG: acetyl-CoA carboxylase carboxyltransferase subunit alpha [Verrucomicrobiota bacterium]